MTPPPAPFQRLQTFRQKLLGVFALRADALFELVDALLLTFDLRSPVELSLSPAFRRRFSMVYDALRHGAVEPEAARTWLAEAEPSEAIQVAGYAVYATVEDGVFAFLALAPGGSLGTPQRGAGGNRPAARRA